MRVILWDSKGGMRFKAVVLERRKEVKTTLKNFVYKIKLKLLNTY